MPRHAFDPVALVLGAVFVAAGAIVLAGGELITDGRALVPVGLIALGVALLVQGLGKSKPADGGEEVVTHDALAVLTWDPEGDRYLFRHYTADGHEGESVLEPFEDGWRWGFRDPRHGVDVRFTIRLGADAWRETGEVSRDGGATWQPMLGMELRRAGG